MKNINENYTILLELFVYVNRILRKSVRLFLRLLILCLLVALSYLLDIFILGIRTDNYNRSLLIGLLRAKSLGLCKNVSLLLWNDNVGLLWLNRIL